MTLSQSQLDESNKTPIVIAIKTIVRQSGSDALLIDYKRDAIAFSALWALDGKGVPTTGAGIEFLEQLANDNRAIILLDTEASNVIDADKYGPHLNALDWAHAACFALMQCGKNLPRIAVLDLRDPNSMVMSVFSRFKRPGSAISYFARTSEGIESFSNWLKSVTASMSGLASGMSRDLKEEIELESKQWVAGVGYAVSRVDHHAINNSVAPLALAARFPDIVKAAVLDARKEHDRRATSLSLGASAMMRAFEWFTTLAEPGASANSTTSTFEPLNWGELFAQVNIDLSREVRILILDDQISEGWIPILAYALSMITNKQEPGSDMFVEVAATAAEVWGQPRISLYVATRPEAVLRELLQSNAESRVENFALGFTQPSELVSEILFADLRLFSEAEGADREIAFFKDILELAQQHDAIDNEEYVHLDAWLNSDSLRGRSQLWSESPEYLQALTLLIRTIAKRDLSLPIVLFSSTGQKSIATSLTKFPSICTALEKPRLDGYLSADAYGNFFGLMKNALSGHALPYASARARVQQLLKFVPKEQPNRPFEPIVVEIFTDEAGSDDSKKPFIVSLIAVSYSCADPENKWAMAEQLNARLPDLPVLLPGRPSVTCFTYNNRAKSGHIDKPERIKQDTNQHKLYRDDTAVLFNTLLSSKEITKIKTLSLLGNRDTHIREDVLGDHGLDQLNFGMLRAGVEALRNQPASTVVEFLR